MEMIFWEMLIQIRKEATLLPSARLCQCLLPSFKRAWVVPAAEANAGSEQRSHVGLKGKAWVGRKEPRQVLEAWGGQGEEIH